METDKNIVKKIRNADESRNIIRSDANTAILAKNIEKTGSYKEIYSKTSYDDGWEIPDEDLNRE